MDLITLQDDELAYALCQALETGLPVITARQARQEVRDFVWVNSHDVDSPGQWWVANIGTDHGPESADDLPIEWRPVEGLTDDMEVAWRIVEEMKCRGWLFHILAMVEGWVVNAQHYTLPQGTWDGEAMASGGFVQEIGETAPEAICRAALAAFRITPRE